MSGRINRSGFLRAGIVFFFLGAAAAFAAFYLARKPSPMQHETRIERLDAVQQLKSILKLGVIEARVSQIYEIRKDNLKIYQISIPWTGQRSVLAVKGGAQIGYDLQKTEVSVEPGSGKVEVGLPEPAVLSIDLDFRFLQEEDSFLRRLTPDDRNRILEAVKNQVRGDLLGPGLSSEVETRLRQLIADFGRVYGLQIQVSKLTESKTSSQR